MWKLILLVIGTIVILSIYFVLFARIIDMDNEILMIISVITDIVVSIALLIWLVYAMFGPFTGSGGGSTTITPMPIIMP